MTSLRKRMTEDMQVRNLALNTQMSYVQQVSLFARHFSKSPEQLGPEDILWGIGGFVVMAVVGMITAAMDNQRENRINKELQSVTDRLNSHRAALDLKQRFQDAAKTAEQLKPARAQLARIEEDIARNREIVSMR